MVNGNILHFIETSSFDDHWFPYANSELPEPKLIAGEHFLAPLFEINLQGKTVIDVGGGNGVHAHILLKRITANELYWHRQFSINTNSTHFKNDEITLLVQML